MDGFQESGKEFGNGTITWSVQTCRIVTSGFPSFLWHPINEINVPCTVQWELLRYSAPSSLNNDLLDGGVILKCIAVVVNMPVRRPLQYHLHTDTSLLGRSEVGADDKHGLMGLEA